MSSELPERDPGIARKPPAWRKWRTFVLGRRALTMANLTDRLAHVYEDRTVFLLDRPLRAPYFEGSVVSFRALNRLVRRAASVLRGLGVSRGDRVILATLNRIELAFVELGAQRLGAVPVPLNFMLTKEEVQDLVARSGARVVVTDRAVFDRSIGSKSELPGIEAIVMVSEREVPEGIASFHALMAEASEDVEPVDLADCDPAIIFFTAGTTGRPKGAVLTSGALTHALRRYAMIAALLPTATKRLALLVMPLAHTGGHQALLIQMALAIPCLVMGTFDPSRVLDAIERLRVSLFTGIPAMYRMLLGAGARDRDLSSVWLWGGGGDAFPSELVDEFRALTRTRGRRIGAAFVIGYGLAETAGQVSMTPPFAAGEACLGWLMPGISHRIVGSDGRDVRRGEVGELWIKSPGLMSGYWDDPAGSAEALVEGGWLRTGDLVRRGRFGLKFFVSREKEMIKVGGYSLFPAEVERVLDAHPAVERSIVVGLPHHIKGELPVAAIVLRSGSTATEEEILAWAQERVAPYRQPRRVVITDEIPEGFGMKPLRRIVRARLIEMRIVVATRAEQAALPGAGPGWDADLDRGTEVAG